MKKSMEQKIASVELQLKTLRDRHAKAEARRKRDEAQLAKRDEARRRELTGSVVLEKVRGGEIAEAQFRKWMDGSLEDSKDRALFGL
jgi:hypothetical protein